MGSIVERLDVIKQVGPCIGQAQVTLSMDTFALDHAREAIGRRVGSAVTHGAHAAEDVVIKQEALAITIGALGGLQ